MQPFVEWIDTHPFYVKQEWDWEQGEWRDLRGKPGRLVLSDQQRRILSHVFTQDENGKFPYKTVLLSMTKKSGKTTLAAAIGAWFADQSDPGSEIYIIANDQEQAEGRVGADMKFHYKQLNNQRSETGEDKAVVNKYRITLPNDTFVQILAQSYKTSAGSRHSLTLWDELWGFCRNPVPVLTADLRWVMSDQLKVGDRLVSFEDQRTGKYRSYKTGTVLQHKVIKADTLKVSLSNGQEIIGTPIHRMLGRKQNRHVIEWIELKDLKPGDKLLKVADRWEELHNEAQGYLAGSYDGEGSLSHKYGVRLDFSQRENKMFYQVKKYMSDLGFSFRTNRGGGGTNKDVYGVAISQKGQVMRFLGMIRPHRLLDKFIPENLGRLIADRYCDVISVEENGEQEVVSMLVDTGTYIGDGFCDHNTLEDSLRMWDEMTPIPTVPNSLRVITTYAGFEGESKLLWDLYTQGVGVEEYKDGLGKRIPELIDLPCWVNGSQFTYWEHEPTMPWQTKEYLEEEMRSNRPAAYLRLHENRWVSSHETFIPIEWWDRAAEHFESPATFQPEHPYRKAPCIIAIDAAVKRDCTAVVGMTYDNDLGKAILLFHHIWSPKEDQQFDLDTVLERYVREICSTFDVVKIICDPMHLYQMISRLRQSGIPIDEFTQSVGNMTKASQALFETLQYNNLWAYPADDLRSHVRNAVAKEETNGFRIVKEPGRSSNVKKHVDGAIALAMCTYEVLRGAQVDLSNPIRLEIPFSDLSGWKPQVDYKLPFEFQEL